MTTIDFKDAFGSIPHSYISEMMKEVNLPEKLRLTIEDTYKLAKTKLLVGNETSGDIPVRRGVKPGCPLSPLIFNLCLNSLLNVKKKSNRGYRVGSQTISVQAYADDVVIFAETKENMAALLKTVEDFTQYSRLAVNAKKCRSISYILANKRRIVDEHTFSIHGEQIPGTNLAEWTDYLGTAAATTLQTRMKGTEEALWTASQLIDKIQKSGLKLNQKLDAMRRFVIPTLNGTLTEGSPRLDDLKKLDFRCVTSSLSTSVHQASLSHSRRHTGRTEDFPFKPWNNVLRL
jgi:hypothetical protein